MKTYVLTISKTFPKKLNRSGELTNFDLKIERGQKLHTIRANYELWKKRFIEIDTCKAVLSIRYWTDKPYRSKQIELFRLSKTEGIGLQKIVKINFDVVYGVAIEKRKHDVPFETNQVASNDGLSLTDFKDWFNGYDLNKPMALIHFTDFRY